MKNVLSLALVLALAVGSLPLAAQQPFAATVPAPSSGFIVRNGPIAAAAFREASRTPLITADQDEPTADSEAALRVAAQRIPLGAKVNVQMRSGQKIRSGRLRSVGDTDIVIEKPGQSGWDSFGNKVGQATPRTTVEVPYDALRSIERNRSTRNLLVGLSVVVGAVLVIDAAVSRCDPLACEE